MTGASVIEDLFMLVFGGVLLLSSISGVVRGEMRMGVGSGRGRLSARHTGLALYVVGPIQALIGFGLLVIAAVDFFNIFDIGDLGFFAVMFAGLCAASALNFVGTIIGLATHADDIREGIQSTIDASRRTPDDWS